jgi:hypothetical protein
MFGDFLLKQMLQKQLANLPQEQRDTVMKAFEENPEFFKGLFNEVGERIKKGESQQAAVIAVLLAKQSELQALFGK